MLETLRKEWDRLFGVEWALECVIFDKTFDSPSIRYLIQLIGGKVSQTCQNGKHYILITNHHSKQLVPNNKIKYVLYASDVRKWVKPEVIKQVEKWEQQQNPRYPPHVRTYKTHQNGSRPLLVCINEKDNTFDVWVEEGQLKSSYSFSNMYLKKLINSAKYSKVWVGDEMAYYRDQKWFTKRVPYASGNSILFEIGKNKYLLAWESVVRFSTNTPINMFRSIIGNNDTPDPFAISRDDVFLFDDFVKLPKRVFSKQDLQNPVGAYHKRQNNIINKKDSTPIQGQILSQISGRWILLNRQKS